MRHGDFSTATGWIWNTLNLEQTLALNPGPKVQAIKDRRHLEWSLLLHANHLLFDSLSVTGDGLACTLAGFTDLTVPSYSNLGKHHNWLDIDLTSCKKEKCLTLAVGDFLLSEAIAEKLLPSTSCFAFVSVRSHWLLSALCATVPWAMQVTSSAFSPSVSASKQATDPICQSSYMLS
jgi:hypothetical protein